MKLPGKAFDLTLEGTCVVDAFGMHEIHLPAPIQVKSGKYMYQITIYARIAMKKVIYDESLDYFALPERGPRLDHPFLSMRLTDGKITQCFLSGGANRKNREFSYHVRISRRPLYLGESYVHYFRSLREKAETQEKEILAAAENAGDAEDVAKTVPVKPELPCFTSRHKDRGPFELDEQSLDFFDVPEFKHERVDVDGNDGVVAMRVWAGDSIACYSCTMFLDGRTHELAKSVARVFKEFLTFSSPRDTNQNWRICCFNAAETKLPIYRFESVFRVVLTKEQLENLMKSYRRYADAMEALWNHTMCRPGGPHFIDAAQADTER